MLRIPRQTISDWENEGNNTGVGKTSIPDCRVVIPKSECEKVYERVKAGEKGMTKKVKYFNRAAMLYFYKMFEEASDAFIFALVALFFAGAYPICPRNDATVTVVKDREN